MPSKLGIHGIMPGATLDVLRQLIAKGATMTTIKAVEGPGWLKDVKQLDPDIHTMGRFVRGKDRSMDVEGPRLDGDLKKSAQEVMYNLFPRWEEHRAYVDYWEVINEQDPPGADGHRRLAEFMMHCMDFAEAEGYKLGLFSYSLGVPEWEEMQAVVEMGVFGRAKAGGHALALHEYAYPMDTWYGEPLPGRPVYPNRGPLACRYRWWYEDFLKPRDEVIPLYLTEVNLARDLPQVSVEEWMQQMAWYDARLREDYYVVGAHIFTLGSGGGWEDYEFDRMLPALIDHIIALKDTQDPVWTESPAPTQPSPPPPPSAGQPQPPPPSGQPEISTPVAGQPVHPAAYQGRHYLLFPPDTDWAWIAACQRYWETFHVSLGTSLEEAGYGPQGQARAVTVVNPDKWGRNMQAFFLQNHPDVRYDPLLARSPQELGLLLNWRVDKGRRFGGG